MKRVLCLLLALTAAFSLAACGDDAPTGTGNTAVPNVNELLNVSSTPANKYATVDIDLTAMSSTVAYSMVAKMWEEPDKYRGKTVRMKGAFAYTQQGNNYYYACVVTDTTACCSQWIEFVTADARTKPADFPSQGTEITVAGVFGTYNEGDSLYCQLSDAVMR